MILARKVVNTSHWMNYGCFTPNIAVLNGMTDAEQEAYLELVKNIFPNVPGALPWVRGSRYGIEVTGGTPNWNTNLTRYWPNMYYRPSVADFMSGRYVVFEPILWVRQNASTPVMCNPNASPNYFGRNSSGTQVVADADNTWRRDIRLNLDRLMDSDVGSSGGEPYTTRAKYTNYRNLMVLGPDKIDAWRNARLYYVADGEVVAVVVSDPTIFDDYNIDVLVSGNMFTRMQQEGYSGWQRWIGAGATPFQQGANVVSQGDGMRINFADYANSFVMPAGLPVISGTPASLTFSAYIKSVGVASLTGVRLQLDWGQGGGSSLQTFTVTDTMTQYSITANRPGPSTEVVPIILREAAGGVIDVDFLVLRSSTTLPTPVSTSQARTGAWSLVLDDDFDTFNTSNWTKAVAFGWTDFYGDSGGVWNDNLVTVANSRLRLTMQQINGVWNSGLVLSKGKKEYTYGYFEANIKLSPAQGAFPAWWLFPVNPTYGSWPSSGEIDIMEHPGAADVRQAGCTLNFTGPGGLTRLQAVTGSSIDWSADFHRWGCLWEKSTDNRVIARFFVDDAPYGMFDQSEWPAAPGGSAGSPFDHPYFMILNLGVGGEWSGSPVAASSGAFIEIDSVRVWQRT